MSNEKKDPYDDMLTLFAVSLPFQRWNANPLPPGIKDSEEENSEESDPQADVVEISGSWLFRALKKTARFLIGR